MDETPRRPRAGGVIILLGGIVILVSTPLEWGRITVVANGAHDTFTGATLAALFGGGVLVVGLLTLIVPSHGARVALGALTILVGLVTLLGAGTAAGSKGVFLKLDADRIADARGLDRETVEDQLKAAERAGAIEVTPGPGLFVLLAGGLLAGIGGIVSIVRAGSRPLGPAPPPPPPPGAAAPPPPGSGEPAG